MPDKSQFLKLTIKASIGIWPSENYVYRICRGIIIALYKLFVATIIIGLKDILQEKDTQRQAYIIQFVVTYTFILWKLLLSQKTSIIKLMKVIADTERNITSDDDDNVKKIYRSCVEYNYNFFWIITLLCTSVAILLVTVSYFEIKSWYVVTPNATVIERDLPLPQWFPYGQDHYFELQYFYQLSMRLWGAVIYIATETLFIALIYFPVVRLKVLGYNLKHFGDKNGGGNPEAYLKHLIFEHKEIIKYVMDLNNALKIFLFIDFLVRSYHISFILLNITAMVENIEVNMDFLITFAFTLFYFTAVFVQMCCMYYSCNEIILESMEIANNICRSNWYDQTLEIKRSLMIMIIRSQKPLELKTGGLYAISNDLIVGYVKAGFTYILFSRIKS